MRKTRALVLLVLFLLSIVPVFANFEDSRLEAMGSIGLAVSDDRHPLVVNPAALYFYGTDYSFIIDGKYNDSFILNSGEAFPILPASSLNASFIGKMISFSIGFDYKADKLASAEGINYYNIYQESEIRLNLSIGYGRFSAGLGIYGGSSKQRSNISIHTDSTISDFFIQTFLADYDRMLDSEFLQMNLGLMFKSGGLSIGILFDNLLDTVDSKSTISWQAFLSDAGIGFYYAMDEYGKRGRLNLFNFSFGVELKDLFDKDTRALNAGLELGLVLAKNYGFYFRTGYRASFNSFGWGVHSVGLGAQLNNVDLFFNALLPVSVYKGQSEDRVKLVVSFTVRV